MSNTTTATEALTSEALTPAPLKGVQWETPMGIAQVENTRLWGVRDAEGRFLTFDGESPAAWGTKNIAALVVAGGLAAGTTWIEVAA